MLLTGEAEHEVCAKNNMDGSAIGWKHAWGRVMEEGWKRDDREGRWWRKHLVLVEFANGGQPPHIWHYKCTFIPTVFRIPRTVIYVARTAFCILHRPCFVRHSAFCIPHGLCFVYSIAHSTFCADHVLHTYILQTWVVMIHTTYTIRNDHLTASS